jgi:fumarate hydratase class II
MKNYSQKFRVAADSMGEMKIPAEMLHGASTQRAVLNFPVSGRRFPRIFIYALAQIKASAARTNLKLGRLKPLEAGATIAAALAVRDGKYDAHFPLDIFQTGSGTSTNMNANEVIANVATRALGSKGKVHPNGHVNKGQSSNDVIPTAIHVAVVLEVKRNLLPALERLAVTLEKKSRQYARVNKIGRTHLQDATPIFLGQEFGGWASQVRHAIKRLGQGLEALRELPIGGTAVGTGINTHPKFAAGLCSDLNREFKEKFFEARNHFEAQSAKDACVEMSGDFRTAAVSLTKIANDIRWMGCGPRAGFAELKVPAVQPGSSIMPGKINPVIAESLLQVCAEVVGNDATVAWAGASSSFELNVMMPVIAWNLLESARLLGNAVAMFEEKCVRGIEADTQVCEGQIEKSLMLCTALVPIIGYDLSAKLAKEAHTRGLTIRQIVLEKKLVDEKTLTRVLNAKNMSSGD